MPALCVHIDPSLTPCRVRSPSIQTCRCTAVRRVCLRRGWVRRRSIEVDHCHRQEGLARLIRSIRGEGAELAMRRCVQVVPVGYSLDDRCLRRRPKRNAMHSKRR